MPTCYYKSTMNKLLNTLKTNPMTIIVATPLNSVEMARAAEANGAHAIKTHINMTHRASQVTFGTLEEERPVLTEIIHSVNIPVGIVPGASLDVGLEMIIELAEMGFDFFDMFAHFMKPELFQAPGISRMAAVDSSMDLETVGELSNLGVEMLEGAIISPEGYGAELSIVDLARYRILRKHVSIPLIIPSQRTLKPENISSLYDLGVEGVLVGVLSTGKDADQLARQVAAFREAAEKL